MCYNNLSVLSVFVDMADKFTIEQKIIVSKFTLVQSCVNLPTTHFTL